MGEIACFLLTKSRLVQKSLRRYRHKPDERCILPFGYHNAEVVIESEVPPVAAQHHYNGMGTCHPEDVGVAKDDPRWPQRCLCGYLFREDDEWQYNEEFLWKNAVLDVSCVLAKAPPGAMWDAHWHGAAY